MPLPAIAAGVARGLATAGRGLAKGAQRFRKRPPLGGPPAETEEEAPEEKKDKTSSLLSPEGVLMLFVGGLLDILSIIGAILILAFGFGLLFAKIVYIVGLIIVGSWAFFRSGKLPTRETGKLPVGGKGINIFDLLFGGFKFFGQFFKGFGIPAGRFLKRHWLKLAGKAIPAIGDVLPLWTYTVYSELTSA